MAAVSEQQDETTTVPPGVALARLRMLPSVDEVLNHPELQRVIDDVGRPRCADWARQSVDSLRTSLVRTNGNFDRKDLLTQAVRATAEEYEARITSRLGRVINATGVLLHTNLGRAPLADAAIDAVAESSRFTNIEFDLATGRRGRRGADVERLLCELTGAAAALVVNNCAAATLLVLQTLAAGREVVISRGQLIEIGGSYRLPDVFAASGAVLREVGTTNRTRLADYESAICEDTAALLRVHHSNYRIVGFTEDVPIGPLVELAHSKGLPAVDDLGSGCLHDLTPFGLTGEPLVGDSLNCGADVVLFSGDKLLGGPQCGVILGGRELVDRLRASPLTRALRVDKLTLAALSATLQIHAAGRAFDQIPVLRMIAAGADDLHRRAAAICEEVKASSNHADCDPVALESTVGGGALPAQTQSSWAVRLPSSAPQETALRLRSGRPAVVGRIENDAILLDLRSVLPEEDQLLSQRLASL
ncbi:MAG: L-seryl-tRNA(Sec) selenium transferase [Planctomycetota bacterium]|nr:MAG: L-seryl-tRNA(Sec) selenium transferase [Planctomycetota bacterium]REK23040.1 MAG: L-seryl-tRNA(Sec) selenium transferase [Planctomycetota bacterium]REK34056.1 MAG: L-seryl-tRNA(Sec) selenium transferase [Planctomycetota bacterium]